MPTKTSRGAVRAAHFGTETNYGDGVTQSSATAMACLSDSDIDIQTYEEKEVDEATGTRDGGDGQRGRRLPAQFTLTEYLRFQPTPATPSPVEEHLLAAMGSSAVRVSPSGNTVGTSATASFVQFAAANAHTAYRVTDAVVINGRFAVVKKVHAGANGITISPPLTSVPSAGDAIGSARTFLLGAEQPSVGADFLKDKMVINAAGGVVKTFEFSGGGGDLVKLRYAGDIGAQVQAEQTTLAADVADGTVTTFTVGHATAAMEGSTFDCEGETGILVTAVNLVANTLTVVRGAGAAAHASGVTLVPSFLPVSPAPGDPIHGWRGRALRGQQEDGTPVSIPARIRSFSLENGTGLDNTEDGGPGPTAVTQEGNRTVKVTRTMTLRHGAGGSLRWLRSAQSAQIDRQPELYELWNATGDRGVMIYLDRVSLAVPKISESAVRTVEQSGTSDLFYDADGNMIPDGKLIIATC